MNKTKGLIQVTPEVSINVELDANNLVDIHVAMKEQELIDQEKTFLDSLKAAEENQNKAFKALSDALLKLGEEKAEEMTEQVFPTLKDFGFKNLLAKCCARTSSDMKHVTLNYAIEIGKSYEARSIYTDKKIKIPAHIKVLEATHASAEKELQKIKDELLKVKQGLSSVDRMERKARAQMAIRALESTKEGRMMLDGIRKDAQKALPAPRD